MRALCLDPSFAATGYVAVDIPLAEGAGGLRALDLIVVDGCFGTIQNKDSAASHNDRLGTLYDHLLRIVAALRAQGPLDLLAAEIPPHLFRISSEAAIRYQLAAYTTVRLVAHTTGLPLLEVAPEQSKKAAVGQAKADKKAVRQSMGFQCLGDAETKWPRGWDDNAIDALTVGFWLDTQYRLHLQGHTTPLSPYLPALALP